MMRSTVTVALAITICSSCALREGAVPRPFPRPGVGTHVKVKKSGRVSSRRFGLWVRRGF